MADDLATHRLGRKRRPKQESVDRSLAETVEHHSRRAHFPVDGVKIRHRSDSTSPTQSVMPPLVVESGPEEGSVSPTPTHPVCDVITREGPNPDAAGVTATGLKTHALNSMSRIPPRRGSMVDVAVESTSPVDLPGSVQSGQWVAQTQTPEGQYPPSVWIAETRQRKCQCADYNWFCV